MYNRRFEELHNRNFNDFNRRFEELHNRNIRNLNRQTADNDRQNTQQQSNHFRGLTSERIEKFQHFDVDESMVGEQCIVCLSDLKIGTQMVRLDCHVDHYLCKTCTNVWFKDHNTCPTCRHTFT